MSRFETKKTRIMGRKIPQVHPCVGSKYEMKFKYYTNSMIVLKKINGQVNVCRFLVVFISTKALSVVDACAGARGIESLFCFA